MNRDMNDITPGEAVEIFRNIRSLEYTREQKYVAVRMVSRMRSTMLNKITKNELMEVVRWQNSLQE